jgi:P pilus assembly chaperone PapD
MQVQDEAQQTFGIRNTGKYEFTFNCSLTKESLKRFFQIEPVSGEIAAGATQTVSVIFNQGQTLDKELRLRHDKCMRLVLTEPLTAAQETMLTVPMSLAALYSKYSLNPRHSIDFGPLIYNMSSNSRKLELSNVGQFPFSFRLFDVSGSKGNEGSSNSQAQGKKDAKSDKSRGKGAASTSQVQIGPFVLSPELGSVNPGATATIEVCHIQALAAKAKGIVCRHIVPGQGLFCVKRCHLCMERSCHHKRGLIGGTLLLCWWHKCQKKERM